MTSSPICKAGRYLFAGAVNNLKATWRLSSTQAVTNDAVPFALSADSEAVFQREDKYGAHNYHSLPVVLNRGQGLSNILWMMTASMMWMWRRMMFDRCSSVGRGGPHLLRFPECLLGGEPGPLPPAHHPSAEPAGLDDHTHIQGLLQRRPRRVRRIHHKTLRLRQSPPHEHR